MCTRVVDILPRRSSVANVRRRIWRVLVWRNRDVLCLVISSRKCIRVIRHSRVWDIEVGLEGTQPLPLSHNPGRRFSPWQMCIICHGVHVVLATRTEVSELAARVALMTCIVGRDRYARHGLFDWFNRARDRRWWSCHR